MRQSKSLAAMLLIFGTVGPAAAADDVTIIPDVVYGHKHGLAMTFDVFQPTADANGAGVLFMVSGGWYSSWRPPERLKPMFQPLLEKGFTVFAVRHGSSPKFTIPEAVGDVRRSVRYIRLNAEKFGIDPNRIGVFGGSAGGHLSLVLGTTGDDGDPDAKDPVRRVSSRVHAVVSYYPPTDLRPWVKPESPYYKNYPALRFDAKLADRFSPRLQASKDDPPTLLVHGDKDKLVPLEHSEKMLEAFKEAQVPVDLLVIEGAAHGFPGKFGQLASSRLVDWFERHLTKK